MSDLVEEMAAKGAGWGECSSGRGKCRGGMKGGEVTGVAAVVGRSGLSACPGVVASLEGGGVPPAGMLGAEGVGAGIEGCGGVTLIGVWEVGGEGAGAGLFML